MPKSATVYIWMPGKYYLAGIGHASIVLDTGVGVPYYITWMAQGNPLAAPVPWRSKPYFRKLGTPDFGLAEDKEGMEGFFNQAEPHHFFNLPTLNVTGREGLRLGVDVARVEAYWKARLLARPDYAFLSKTMNCTGCVAEALDAGGLGYYASKPFNFFVQDARTLKTWIEDAIREIDRLNFDLQVIATTLNKVTTYARQKGLVSWVGIPTLAEWVRESDSDVRFRGFASRSEETAAIDRLISLYHSTAPQGVNRFASLVRMQREIYSHLTYKPESDRHDAFVKLGATVATVMDKIYTTHLPAVLASLDDSAYRKFIGLLMPVYLSEPLYLY